MPRITARPNSDRDRQGPAWVSSCSCFHMRNKTISHERAFPLSPSSHTTNHKTQKSQDLDSPAPLIPGFLMGLMPTWPGPLCRLMLASLVRRRHGSRPRDLADCKFEPHSLSEPTTTAYYL